jgi:hypothetical protein
MTSDCLPHQVAESLLVADQTIDTLSAEVEEARARAAQLEGDLAVAKEAAARIAELQVQLQEAEIDLEATTAICGEFEADLAAERAAHEATRGAAGGGRGSAAAAPAAAPAAAAPAAAAPAAATAGKPEMTLQEAVVLATAAVEQVQRRRARSASGGLEPVETLGETGARQAREAGWLHRQRCSPPRPLLRGRLLPRCQLLPHRRCTPVGPRRQGASGPGRTRWIGPCLTWSSAIASGTS